MQNTKSPPGIFLTSTWLCVFLMQLFSSCGSGASGCGGEITPIFNVYANIKKVDKWAGSGQVIKFHLVEPFQANYEDVENSFGIPVLISNKQMKFNVLLNDTLVDTLIVKYEIKANYVAADVCNSAYYEPECITKEIKSTGHFFNVLSF